MMPRKPKPPEFLQQFCLQPDTRQTMYVGMTAPWAVDGCWYATDGAVLIAHRSPGLKARMAADRVPTAETCQGVLPDPKKGKWLDWPTRPETARCPWCDLGTRAVCDDCEGTGNAHYKVNGVWITRRYFNLIKALPSVCYKYRKAIPGSRKPVQFRYDNGVGAVMPVFDVKESN